MRHNVLTCFLTIKCMRTINTSLETMNIGFLVYIMYSFFDKHAKMVHGEHGAL